jgi:twitching motility protein PilT
MDIDTLLRQTINQKASDLHIETGYPAMIRVDSKLQSIISKEVNQDEMNAIFARIMKPDIRKHFDEDKEIDFSYALDSGERFRVNAFTHLGNFGAAFRYIPNSIPTIETLHLPQILVEISKLKQGFVLVVGPTGSGKSTTLASIINHSNLHEHRHIITIEDPVEYVYPKALGLVAQREIEHDTTDWPIALRSILRQDPNIVLIGEMRDKATMQAALTIAETGHLVFSTLHTNSASESISRIINSFQAGEQGQIRSMLASNLTAVLSQRLVPIIGGGRRAAMEILLGSPAISNSIREGKEFQIDNIIRTSFDFGMVTLERSLVGLIREGVITIDDAQKYSRDPQEILRLLRA